MSNDIAKRVLEFCELSSLINHYTNDFFPASYYEDPSNGPLLTKKISDWNIKTYDDWDNIMRSEIRWVIKNKKQVLQVLPPISKEWPEACKSIRTLIQMAK